jgi:hypothetical protein
MLVGFLAFSLAGYFVVDKSSQFINGTGSSSPPFTKPTKKLILSSTGLSPAQGKVTHTAFFDVKIDNQPSGRINIALYGEECPKTVRNFLYWCSQTKKDVPALGGENEGEKLVTGVNGDRSYANSPFHRVIPKFMLQGGDITRGVSN